MPQTLTSHNATRRLDFFFAITEAVVESPIPFHRIYSTMSGVEIVPFEPNKPPAVYSPFYMPLDEAKREIRLLKIDPFSDKNEPVRCTLFRGYWGDKDHAYNALSYVWGDPKDTETILVNGYPFEATKNLTMFFKQFRELCEDNPDLHVLSLWVDAISINQSDIRERNSQVRQMGQIYRHSTRVFSWLGPKQDLPVSACQVVNLCAKAIPKSKTLVSWLDESEKLLCKFSRHPASTTTTGNDAWNSITDILRRPYWTRVWTFQEACLAPELILICGLEFCTLDAFRLLNCWLLSLPGQDRPSCMDVELWDKLQSTMFVINVMETQTIMRITLARDDLHRTREGNCEPKESRSLVWKRAEDVSSMHSTDPRDKVYGLLGLIEFPMDPDYTKSVRDVFYEFVQPYVAEQLGQILHRSGICQQKNVSKEWCLPSWVPSFGQPQTNFGETYCYKSSDNNPPVNRQLHGPYTQDGVLYAWGILCDEVTSIERALKLQDLFTFSCNYIQGNTTYPTGVPLLQAFVRVLLKDMDLALKLSRIDPGSRSFQEHASALLHILISQYIMTVPGKPLREWISMLGLPDGERFGPSLGAKLYGESYDGEVIFACKSPMANLKLGMRMINELLVYFLLKFELPEHLERIFQTKGQYFGVALEGSLPGDQVCVLIGSNLPVILRKVGDRYIHVGPCFVLGLMDGEAMEDLRNGTRELVKFEIE